MPKWSPHRSEILRERETYMKLLKLNLHLFEGEGMGEGNAEVATQTGEETVVDTNESSTEIQNEKTPEDRRKDWDALIKGEYKEFYTKDTQDIINKRFKETKNLEKLNKKQGEILETLYTKYKVEDIDGLKTAIENDDAMWIDAADEAGMTVDQFKQFNKLQRENKAFLEAQAQREADAKIEAQVQAWQNEAENVKVKYPSFDLKTELENPQFMSLLKSGVQMSAAYEVAHLNDIKQATQAATQKAVADNIRARGQRPSENGTSSQGAFTIKNDPSKFSRQDFDEIKQRVARGEVIRL